MSEQDPHFTITVESAGPSGYTADVSPPIAATLDQLGYVLKSVMERSAGHAARRGRTGESTQVTVFDVENNAERWRLAYLVEDGDGAISWTGTPVALLGLIGSLQRRGWGSGEV